jgi:predicted lactoylglutathione lyase
MNEDVFNTTIRKFLKMLGVTAQREIEKAVRQAILAGRLIPLADHSEFMMYGNDVMDLTILGLRSM